MISHLPAASCAFDYATTFAVVKDLVVAAGTIFAIYAGVRGFSQWREIEWAKADFDISRRLLTAVFKTRDWLNNSRRWMTLTNEYPDDYDSSTATLKQKRDAHLHMFNNRFGPVRDCAVELQSLRPEAEALWGHEIVELTGNLLVCVRKLETAMGMYVRMIGTYDPSGQGRAEVQFEHMVFDVPLNITAQNLTGEENAFTKEIRLVVDTIEQYVRDKQRPVKRARP